MERSDGIRGRAALLGAQNRSRQMAADEADMATQLDPRQGAVAPPLTHGRDRDPEELGDLGCGHQLGARESARGAAVVGREPGSQRSAQSGGREQCLPDRS